MKSFFTLNAKSVQALDITTTPIFVISHPDCSCSRSSCTGVFRWSPGIKAKTLCGISLCRLPRRSRLHLKRGFHATVWSCLMTPSGAVARKGRAKRRCVRCLVAAGSRSGTVPSPPSEVCSSRSTRRTAEFFYFYRCSCPVRSANTRCLNRLRHP